MKYRIEEAVYIEPGQVEQYLKSGWTVKALPPPHGCYSAMAIRVLDEYEATDHARKMGVVE